MSADNYNLVRKHEGKFVVSMGFVSDECDPPIHEHDPRFATLEAAELKANEEWTEYGVRFGAEISMTQAGEKISDGSVVQRNP